MRRSFLFLTVLMAVLSMSVGLTAPAVSQTEGAAMRKDRILGDPDAPVTMVEYSSMTCPHCASFHTDTLPQIRENYIDTGKVKLIFIDFPLDGLALRAAMIAQCSGDARYYPFVDMLFKSQSNWSRSPDPIDALTRIARFGGLTPEQVQACLNDTALMDAIVARQTRAGNEVNVRSTPTFTVNGELVVGDRDYAEFEALFDDILSDGS